MKKILVFLMSAIAAPVVMGQGQLLFQDFTQADVLASGGSPDSGYSVILWTGTEMDALSPNESSTSPYFDGPGAGFFRYGSDGKYTVEGTNPGDTIYYQVQAVGQGAEGLGTAGEITLGGGQLPVPGIAGEVIELAIVPEPTSFALAGLGAAALMIFRRRK